MCPHMTRKPLKIKSRKPARFHGMQKYVKIGRPRVYKCKPKKEWRDPSRLKEREALYLYAIRDFQYEERYSPTAGDIADRVGDARHLSKHWLSCLLKKGFIELSPAACPGHRRILFPRGTKFPWCDRTQFPREVFFHRSDQDLPEVYYQNDEADDNHHL